GLNLQANSFKHVLRILRQETEDLEVFSMLKRTITALVLVAIFGIAFYLGPTSLSYLIRLLILLAGYEVYRIKKDTWPSFVLILIIALLFGANLMNEYSMLPFVSITIFSFLFTAIF